MNGMSRPINIYAIRNDDRCRDATIGILQFEKWAIPFQALGIFEDQERISRRVLARFTDVCHRQFSSIKRNENRIKDYLQEQIG